MALRSSCTAVAKTCRFLTRKLLQSTIAADLPIERPTRFKLVANLKTAGALGLTIPTSILLEVIE
jgi:putative ABC transport system substrate-binding protein